MTLFADREAAGRELAASLGHLAGDDRVIVLGLPRGGVPVAAEVAAALGAPLDVLVVRKLGAPGQEELAIGAITAHGAFLNEDLLGALGVAQAQLEAEIAAQRAELRRREAVYRAGKAPLDLTGKRAVIVDDGMATGATVKAAVTAARELGAAEVVVAVPVAAPGTAAEVARLADSLVCPHLPRTLSSVGEWYLDFSQTTDAEVVSALASSARR